jgi:chromosome segregation ATPase
VDFWSIYKVPLTVLAHSLKIDAAAKVALERSPEVFSEPIVVSSSSLFDDDEPFKLVDLHTLLLAQSQVLVLVNHQMQQQEQMVHRHLETIQQERIKVTQYARPLESQQSEIQERNHLLETQKAELLKQSQQITQLNQRFIELGQLLSQEWQQSFQATSDSVAAICTTTSVINRIGHDLDKELKSVQNASRLIEKVSRQVKFLSVQATVAANNSGASSDRGNHSRYGLITNEIGNLVAQTSEAANQVSQIADRFHEKLQQLSSSAGGADAITRSLVEKVERVGAICAEMQDLVANTSQP